MKTSGRNGAPLPMTSYVDAGIFLGGLWVCGRFDSGQGVIVGMIFRQVDGNLVRLPVLRECSKTYSVPRAQMRCRPGGYNDAEIASLKSMQFPGK